MIYLDKHDMLAEQITKIQIMTATAEHVRSQVWYVVTEPLLDNVKFNVQGLTLEQLGTDLR